jgi:hypothetical protein
MKKKFQPGLKSTCKWVVQAKDSRHKCCMVKREGRLTPVLCVLSISQHMLIPVYLTLADPLMLQEMYVPLDKGDGLADKLM